MKTNIEYHLKMNIPQTICDQLNWLQQCEKHSKSLLTELNKNRNVEKEELNQLENKIREIIQHPLSKPAYNTYGHILYLLLKKQEKQITNEPFVLRAYFTDKQQQLTIEDIQNALKSVNNNHYDIISALTDSIQRYLKKQQMNEVPSDFELEIYEIVKRIGIDMILTQDNKEWGLLKDGYLNLIPFISKEHIHHEAVLLEKVSWKCKGKYVMLDGICKSLKKEILPIIPSMLKESIGAVSETTFKSVAVNLIRTLVKEEIVSFESIVDLITEENESSMNIMVSLLSSIDGKTQKEKIQYATKRIPLVTISAMKMNGFDMKMIMEYYPETEYLVMNTLNNAMKKSYHLAIIVSLHSELTRIHHHPLEIKASKEIIKGIYDCLTEEIQVITTLIPKFILRSPIEVIRELFDYMMNILLSPFSERMDSALIQIFTTIIQQNESLKRKDINEIMKEYIEKKSFQLFLQRSLLSRTDKLRQQSHTIYSLLNKYTTIHYVYLQQLLQQKSSMMKSLRSYEADSTARSFCLLCEQKENTPIYQNNEIHFTGKSIEESISSIISELDKSISLIQPSTCASYENDCLYGMFRVIQLLHREKECIDLGIKTIDSSEYLLTLIAPEGTQPSMVVGGWTSIRVASEIIASQSKLKYNDISQRIIHIMRTALHRGMFERAASAFEVCLQNAPNEWLSDEIMKVIDEIQYETKFTRRSAGLPYHLNALLCEEQRRIRQPTQCPPLLSYTFNTLIKNERSNAIHSMNMLAGLIRSQKIAGEIDQFFPGLALNYSFQYMDDIDWSLRNSASILSAAIIKRVFSTKEFFTINHLFALIPQSIKSICEALETGFNSATIVCMILSRLDFTHQIEVNESQQQLAQSLYIASTRKLPAPCVDALANAFTKCITLTQLKGFIEIWTNPNSIHLRIIKEYIQRSFTFEKEQLRKLLQFKPQTSFDCYYYFSLLETLQCKLPELHQFNYTLHDAYTLKCIKLLANYHSQNNDKVLELIQSSNVIIRESALLRVEQHPEGINIKQFIEITIDLLKSENAAHISKVLKAIISLIDYTNKTTQSSIESFFETKEKQMNYQQIISELLMKEPLTESLCVDILMRLNQLEMNHIEKISPLKKDYMYFFNHYLNQKTVSEEKCKVIQYKCFIINSLMKENIEQNNEMTNAYNETCETNYDTRHLINSLLNEIVMELKSFENESEQKNIIEQLLITILNYEVFEYIHQITTTDQLFEPELPNYLYDRFELLKQIQLEINDTLKESFDCYLMKIKELSDKTCSNDSIELMKQINSSLKELFF